MLGLSFAPKRLAYVLDPDATETVDLILERLSAIFAPESDGYLRFRRPAICEVAYEGLPFRLRRRLHAAVASALEQELGQAADADPAILSQHFLHGGDHERARKYALVGAERAVARFAFVEATHLYRRAIDASRDEAVDGSELASTWEELAEALRRTGSRTPPARHCPRHGG